MKKIGLGMSAVIVAIGLFLFWRYATYGHSQEQPASNVHMQQVLEKFYQNPGNYNFFDKDGNSMNIIKNHTYIHYMIKKAIL